MKYSLDISNFLEEISSLPHSIVFLYFLVLITEEGFLISYLFPILFPKNRLAILQNAAFRCLYIPFSPLLFTSFLFIAICNEVAQSCPTVCDPMDCSLPGSSVRGILQARVLE